MTRVLAVTAKVLLFTLLRSATIRPATGWTCSTRFRSGTTSCNLVLWGLLTAGVPLTFTTRGTSLGLTVMLALGFGPTAAVVLQVGEYWAFIRHAEELRTAYTDTPGDLTLSTLGALLAGLAVARRAQTVVSAHLATRPATTPVRPPCAATTRPQRCGYASRSSSAPARSWLRCEGLGHTDECLSTSTWPAGAGPASRCRTGCWRLGPGLRLAVRPAARWPSRALLSRGPVVQEM